VVNGALQLLKLALTPTNFGQPAPRCQSKWPCAAAAPNLDHRAVAIPKAFDAAAKLVTHRQISGQAGQQAMQRFAHE
jgi:hypothetical protein